jgi:hypothetical protein
LLQWDGKTCNLAWPDLVYKLAICEITERENTIDHAFYEKIHLAGVGGHLFFTVRIASAGIARQWP